MREYTGKDYHFWVGNISGYIISSTPQCPTDIVNKKTKERLKYLGFSSDVGFPKKLNTGRMLISPHGTKGEKKQQAKRKRIKHNDWENKRPKKQSELDLIQRLKDFNSGKTKSV